MNLFEVLGREVVAKYENMLKSQQVYEGLVTVVKKLKSGELTLEQILIEGNQIVVDD